MPLERDIGLDAGAMEMPASFVNRFQATVGPNILRLSVAEAFGDPKTARYRGAFIMTWEDARQLGELLLDMVSRAAQPVAAATEKKENG